MVVTSWVALLVVTALGEIATLSLLGFDVSQPLTVAVLALVAIAAERETVRFTAYCEASIGSLVFVFAAVTLGPLAAAIVGVAGLLVDLPRRDTDSPVLRWLSWASLRVLAATAAAFAASAVTHSARAGFLVTCAAVFAAFTAETTTNLLLGSVAPAIRGVTTLRRVP